MNKKINKTNVMNKNQEESTTIFDEFDWFNEQGF
jgi:hypothetical protein